MILVAASTDALRTRVYDGAGSCRFHRSSFIGSDAGKHGVVAASPSVPAASDTPYPVAYRIELDPHSDLDVHFHRANQFQVFVAGDGHIGRHAVQPVSVHYAGAHTAYGPIRPGPRGLAFVTLRDAWDPGARFLPAHKDELRLARTPRRELLAAPLPPHDAAAPVASHEDRLLLQGEHDALGAWALRRPAGAGLEMPPSAGSGGQFWLVLAGTLQLDGAGPRPALPALSCVFVGPQDAAPAATAGPAGVQVLVLRLPARVA